MAAEKGVDNITMQNYMISTNNPIGHAQSVVFNAVNPVLDKTAVKRIVTHRPE